MQSRSAPWLRRTLVALALLPVLALVAATGVWYAATTRIESGVRDGLAQAQAQGWSASMGAPERGGWPLWPAVTYPGVVLTGSGPAVPVPVTWRADRVRVGIALLHPRLLTIAADGGESVRFGTGPELPFTGDVVALAIPLAASGPSALRAVNLRIGSAAADSTAALTVSTLLAHAGVEPAGFRFDVDAVTVGLPQAYPWLFGPRIASLTAAGLLHGPLPSVASASPAEAAAAWRNAGGTLELHRVALDWGPLRGEATATIGLDGDLQPMGAGTFRIEDYPKVLERLTQAGRITRQAAMAATAVLSLIGHATDQNGRQTVELPLKLQDRRLMLGRIPLAHAPNLVWPSQ